MQVLIRLLMGFALLAAGGLGFVGWQVSLLVRPKRVAIEVSPTEFMVAAEDVEFRAADGVPLKGWMVKGRPGAPGLLLCHGLGANRASLVNLVLPLQKVGYHILMFDFRAHGASAGSRSTLGIDEAQDVMGAVDFLAAQPGVDGKRLGGWGKDIGAYALVLAARERPPLRALVLDGLAPNPAFLIGERLFEGTGPLQEPLAKLAALEFSLIFGPRSPAPPAELVLPSLTERNIFIVVSGKGRQAAVGRSLLAAVPEGKDAEKNLLEVEAAFSQNLYGDDRTRYEKAVKQFFLRTLPPERGSRDEPRALQVLEG